MALPNTRLDASIKRLGVALRPNGDATEIEGVLNPASAIDRDGNVVLYPRSVAKGNVSRVGLVKVTRTTRGAQTYERLGFALEPQGEHEIRNEGGYGTEDPRVTFIPVLDLYVMAYVATGMHDGKSGCRVAFAISRDAYSWERIGLAVFAKELGLVDMNDKDGAFFPEPVMSPNGVLSLAFYHRPMFEFEPEAGEHWVEPILRQPFSARQSIRVAYIPLAPVLKDISNLVNVTESVVVMTPDESWGGVKLGGGTPPVRIKEGWLSVYHGIDPIYREDGRRSVRYSGGLMLHDAEQPHKLLFRSPAPIISPETPEELSGIVNNVVFPTGLVHRPDIGERVFDMYYGMADYMIGLARMRLLKRPRRY